MLATKKFSEPIIHQDLPHTNSTSLGANFVRQEFYLPVDYQRSDGRIPPLTGFQVYGLVETGRAFQATLEWTLDHYLFGTGWQTLLSGVTIGAVTDGSDVRFDTFFQDTLDVPSAWLKDRFRFQVKGRSTAVTTLRVPVDYQGGVAVAEGERFVVQLDEGVPYPITKLNGDQGFLYLDPSGGVTYSIQRGFTGLYYVAPNPFSAQAVMARDNTDTPILDAGRQVSLNFHVYGGAGDSGTDFLGNSYRGCLVKESVDNVSTTDGQLINAFWLSKPNPSQFAVECLYFDLTQNGSAAVVDRILMDPITPNVYFSVYYSNDGAPGTTDHEWESKLWKRVPHNFSLVRRETFALPEPITAKYICIEFSQLQPKHYAPGNFQKSIAYKKHPKWVLDYFLLRLVTDTDDHFPARAVNVTYDALQLAYTYYRDDLDQQPLGPEQLGFPSSDLNKFLQSRTDVSDQVDSETLRRISLTMNKYAANPSLLGKNDFILADFAAQTSFAGTGSPPVIADNPTEVAPNLPATDTSNVSSVDRDAIVFEQTMPVMFFYVDCRHFYRTVTASFAQDRAYFAGLREVAFMRDRYSAVYDQPIYVETAGDYLNSDTNDFALVNGTFRTYDDTT